MATETHTNTERFTLTPTNAHKITLSDFNDPDENFFNDRINNTDVYSKSNLKNFIDKNYNFSILNFNIRSMSKKGCFKSWGTPIGVPNGVGFGVPNKNCRPDIFTVKKYRPCVFWQIRNK